MEEDKKYRRREKSRKQFVLVYLIFAISNFRNYKKKFTLQYNSTLLTYLLMMKMSKKTSPESRESFE